MLKHTRLALAAFAVAALTGTAGAQEANTLVAPTTPMPAATAATVAGPRLEGLRSGASLVSPVAPTASRAEERAEARADERAAPAPMQKAPSQRAKTLMIVGGAALLGGAIIGDDAGTIIMLGGLGVGLYGLWLYLQ